MRGLFTLAVLLALAQFSSAAVIIRSPTPAAQNDVPPNTSQVLARPSPIPTNPTLITSTAVVSGNTGTVVWQATTFSGYEGLRAATKITTTQNTTSTHSQVSTTSVETGVETIVAVVFAGGIAWWAASQFGAAEAISEIDPPEEKPDDSRDDDPVCKLDPMETCNNCGGRDSLGLCASGTEIGCPCNCPQEKDECITDTATEENGCPCEPPPQFDAIDILADPTEPPLPTDAEMNQAAQDVIRDIWGGDITKMPGYVAPAPLPQPEPVGPTGDKTCYGTTGPGGNYGFDRYAGLFAIDHLCRTDGPTYTASPDKENGFAGDRFWFDGANNFCMSTAVGTASGWWGHGSVCKGTGVRQVKLSVAFSADQSGCQPLKMWNIPKSQECTDIFSKLVDDCDTDTRTNKNGGTFKQNTPNGCVDWQIWATSA